MRCVPHACHDDKGRLHTTLKHSKQKSHSHKRSEIVSCRRASDNSTPAKDVDGQILGNGQLLKQEIGRILSHQHAHVENGAQPVVLIANEICVLLDVHDGREVESPLVQRLAEVGAQHAPEDAAVHGPKQLLVGGLVNVDCLLAGVCCGLARSLLVIKRFVSIDKTHLSILGFFTVSRVIVREGNLVGSFVVCHG